jgi:hypothetical protein
MILQKRYKKVKSERIVKRRNRLLGIFFILFTLFGIISSDYTLNNIMSDYPHVRVISVKPIKNSYIKVCLIGENFYVNTKYLQRDYENIKKCLKGFLK